MREKFNEALKEAMKGGDKRRVSTLRLINSALKDRDIEARGLGKERTSDDEILQLLQKMIKQRNDSIVVRADLPGVRKEDVQIDVTDDVLTISGERREEREEGGNDQDYRAIERSYGSFYTTVPLPEGANTEKLTAKMHDGVLEITVPLDESARPRRIQIQD